MMNRKFGRHGPSRAGATAARATAAGATAAGATAAAAAATERIGEPDRASAAARCASSSSGSGAVACVATCCCARRSSKSNETASAAMPHATVRHSRRVKLAASTLIRLPCGLWPTSFAARLVSEHRCLARPGVGVRQGLRQWRLSSASDSSVSQTRLARPAARPSRRPPSSPSVYAPARRARLRRARSRSRKSARASPATPSRTSLDAIPGGSSRLRSLGLCVRAADT